MRKRKLLLLFICALLPLVAGAQGLPNEGRHISINLTTGNNIQYDLNSCSIFKPVVRDDKVVWSFISSYWDVNKGTSITDEQFSLANVDDIVFRSYEDDSLDARNALIEFYQATDGDHWTNNENWCSDKPIWEWYGVNADYGGSKLPWVYSLSLNSNNLKGSIPDIFNKMWFMQWLSLAGNDLNGEIPSSIGNMYSLKHLNLNRNKLKGHFPSSLTQIPRCTYFGMEGNELEGNLPEDFILAMMDRDQSGYSLDIGLTGNHFSGKVPISIQQHSRFVDFWPGIVIQDTPLDISGLTIPAPIFTTTDIDGNTIDLAEIYKNNKYTLLYKWGLWCPYSLAYNQKLIPACKGYKDKGLEVIGLHYDLHFDDGLADYMKEHEIPWRNSIAKDWAYIDGRVNSDNRAIFDWGGTPQVFLVDQEGHIVFSSLMDDKGNNVMGTYYRDSLFTFLEEHLGKIEYNYYTSTDYSKDGEVVTLQQATVGQGFDVVFVGEGFVDKDLEDGGSFDQSMSDAMEQFFAYEPYQSLRNRFNVYAVKAVSPNAEFVDGCTHAIDQDVSKALEYASKVTNLIADRPMRVNVVYKSSSGGRSYCMMFEDNSYVCYAMEGANTVLNHEAGGHGIGRLLDEYVESGNETLTLPEENKTALEKQWTTQGWGANVDWRSDPSEVKWAKFINDSRYAEELISVYEGSYLYQYGAYRATENSMMRHNTIGFNAPSREEIYKRVMKESEGDSWTYDFETFVEFDAEGRTQFVNNMNTHGAKGERSSQKQTAQHSLPPMMVKGTWRDALRKNKQVK